MRDYMINEDTVLFFGEYDNGNLFTRVFEGEKSLLVKMPPVKMIDFTLLNLGFSSLRGALDSSKEILGNIRMNPLMINPLHNICVFPHKSPKTDDCVWFNPVHVKRTSPIGCKQSKVHLSFGHSITIDSKQSFFNHKLQRAYELQRISSERTKNPVSFYLEPKKGYQLCKETNQNYYQVVVS